MNQHSKRAGRANGKGVDEVQRGATRPAAVGAIVLCVGFAVTMVAISSCRKPRSHQEMRPQPNASVQSETPKPETESPEPETETPESGAVSPVSVPHRALQVQPSTAAPISQASPAAGQLMANSPTPVQGDQSYDFSHDLNAEPDHHACGDACRSRTTGLEIGHLTDAIGRERMTGFGPGSCGRVAAPAP